MLDDIRAQPHQIGDALWRVEAAAIPTRELAGGLVVCGMGGSAIGGDLAAAAIGSRARTPVRTIRGYTIDPWIGDQTLVLCASYSGGTEETLSCFEAAGQQGAPRVVLTTGGALAERAREQGVPVIGVPSGLQPRAAVAYMTVAALQCAEACGAAPSLQDELEAAVPLLEELAGDDEPSRVAEALDGTIPVVHGAELTAAPARRWKGQINENANVAAFMSDLPEANHNEIEGWAHAREHGPFSAVFLGSPGLHPRVQRRIELYSEVLEADGVPVVHVRSRGDSPVAEVLSLVMLGDLASVALAELGGVDPAAMEAIEAFKQRLS
ncbi:MAG TPA: bifunctional phosphoglucose/phosphomannose isomerase [Thermoleophilaceae bacterium]|nr:bifunctional phosphoglucose/phosphomannose isomerase [Thermoleophilaceae bacterium]